MRKCLRPVILIMALALAGIAAPRVEAETWDVPGDFDTIQAAIDSASAQDTVLVAPGTYVENINFGGKAVTVISSAGAYETIIDGSEPTDDRFGNVVTFCAEEGPDSVLDGFTIIGGSGHLVEDLGDPFTAGGGICCNSGSPRIYNCIISGNYADRGGGIAMISATPTLTNCTITGNVAGKGGGVVCNASSPTIVNCTISGNTAGRGRGILTAFTSRPTVLNSILWGDIPQEIFIQPFWGNTVNISSSNVMGGWGGSMSQDPMFVGPVPAGSITTDGDYHLLPDSPCIDAGDPDTTSYDFPDFDIDDDPRPQGEGYDMGSDEYVDDCTDEDFDGACDDTDSCPDTPPFAVEDDVIGEDGCVDCEVLYDYLSQQVPSDGDYGNHGDYVHHARMILNQYVDAGLISKQCAHTIFSPIAKSDTAKSSNRNEKAPITANSTK